MNEKTQKIFFFLICLLFFIAEVIVTLLYGLASTGDLNGFSIDKLFSSKNIYQSLEIFFGGFFFVIFWWFFIRKKERTADSEKRASQFEGVDEQKQERQHLSREKE